MFEESTRIQLTEFPDTFPHEDPSATDTDALPIDDYVGQWWLVHTKSRNEKALATDLERLGIQHFLPLAHLRRRYRGRPVTVAMPLFPSYLFLCGSEEDRYAALMTHRAAAIIDVVNQDGLRAELRHVYRLSVSDEPVDLYPGLKRGRRCRVTHGSLAGLEGVVQRRRDLCRVYVGVDVLGQSAELEIDASLLEIIE